jgi:predicted ABC-type ATPase
MRMFAGPNGSGKTTVMRNLGRPPEWFGIYINPDDIERSVRLSGQFSLEWTGFSTNTQELRDYFVNSNFLISQGRAIAANALSVDQNVVDFQSIQFDSYYASVLSDFIRRKALAARISFTFETVMSAEDKVDLLKLAQAAGY